MKLENKSILITGGGRGLGRSIALAAARGGASVTILSRTVGELKAVEDQIHDEGGHCHSIVADVSDPQQVHHAVNQTVAHYKTIDVLVNNAAVIGPVRFLEDTDTDAWEKTLGINLNGAFYFCREVVPAMLDKGGGKIINISSGLGRMHFPRFSAYSVSKAGIIQLTRSLSSELKDGNIQVNAVDPGVMDTTMHEEIRAQGPSVLGEGVYQNFLAYKEQGNLKDPDKIARLVVYLASEKSGHLSGHYGGISDYAQLGYKYY
jgi:fengycin family lipopeptide synthetase B